MKKFNNYEEAKKNAQFTGSAQLPEGAYVAKIMGVRYEDGQNGNSDRIVVQFDIAEGEHKDFFRTQYENNQNEDKKWKGRTMIYVPTDDGTERDQWTKNSFAKWPDALEKSNVGYSWDWDEQKWKGKTIGLVFRTTGTVINSKEVTYTEVAFPIEAQTVRDGKAPQAKFRTRNGWTGNGSGASSSANNDFMAVNTSGNDMEVPF